VPVVPSAGGRAAGKFAYMMGAAGRPRKRARPVGGRIGCPSGRQAMDEAKETGAAAKPLSPAARRALAEAAARRAAATPEARPREIDGRGGLEPARYGDWEVKGLASDF
jgi:hypothetical protein